MTDVEQLKMRARVAQVVTDAAERRAVEVDIRGSVVDAAPEYPESSEWGTTIDVTQETFIFPFDSHGE